MKKTIILVVLVVVLILVIAGLWLLGFFSTFGRVKVTKVESGSGTLLSDIKDPKQYCAKWDRPDYIDSCYRMVAIFNRDVSLCGTGGSYELDQRDAATCKNNIQLGTYMFRESIEQAGCGGQTGDATFETTCREQCNGKNLEFVDLGDAPDLKSLGGGDQCTAEVGTQALYVCFCFSKDVAVAHTSVEYKIADCKKGDSESSIDSCLVALAEKEHMSSICDAVSSESDKGQCKYVIAVAAKDQTMCGTIINQNWKDVCYSRIAADTSDISLCDKVSTTGEKKFVFYMLPWLRTTRLFVKRYMMHMEKMTA